MAYFLWCEPNTRIYAIDCFHVGQAELAPFFDIVPEAGLDTESIYEMNVDGTRRPWQRERDGGREDVTETK